MSRETDGREDATGAPFRVTPAAARRVADILAAGAGGTTGPGDVAGTGDGNGGKFFRVSVSGGGCSGFRYDFSIDSHRSADDLVFPQHGVMVAVDRVSLDYLRGVEIDFVDELIGASFRVDNPNVTAQCGCGASFSPGEPGDVAGRGSP